MKMKKKQILVLGDSSVSPLGQMHFNFIDLLEQKKFNNSVEIFNNSCAGLTSADALTNLRDFISGSIPDLLILYAGNCDACAYGIQKSGPSKFEQNIKSKINERLYKRRNILARRNRPYGFREINGIIPELKRCVDENDFIANINAIEKICVQKNIKLILILPVSKVHFPPCNNTGNNIYYKIFNIFDKLPLLTPTTPALLKPAIENYNNGNLEAAVQIYDEIIERGKLNELTMIAANNKGAIYFERGDYRNAKKIIESIDRRYVLKEIILFNMAVVNHFLGKKKEALELFYEAFENDAGTFRIAGSYREIILKKFKPARDSIVIDLASEIHDENFIDYCHPEVKAHEIIMAKIEPAIKKLLSLKDGDIAPELSYQPINPDHYAGYKTDFYSHFQLGQRGSNLNNDLKKIYETTSPMKLFEISSNYKLTPAASTIVVILSHPVFGMKEFFTEFPLLGNFENGRLPEYYFSRMLYPVLQEYKNSKNERFCYLKNMLHGFIPSPEKIDISLKNMTPVYPDTNDFYKIIKRDFTRKALERMENILYSYLRLEPGCYDKYRTISYWFFRESLIFGSPSHYSAYFYRRQFAILTSSAAFINYFIENNSEEEAGLMRIISILNNILVIHKKFLKPYAHKLYTMPKEHFNEYKQAFTNLIDENDFLRKV